MIQRPGHVASELLGEIPEGGTAVPGGLTAGAHGYEGQWEADHTVHSIRYGDHAAKLAIHTSSFDFLARRSRSVPGQWLLSARATVRGRKAGSSF
jgi:hypothetical protein